MGKKEFVKYNMQIKKLFKEFDELQELYGDKNLNAIYGAGQINNPDMCLVFMKPIARNVSADKSWAGLKAPWIGTKNVWKMLYELNILSKNISCKIEDKKPSDWDYKFAKAVYEQVQYESVYITNLSKATQVDARPLKNSVFNKYLNLFKQEIEIVNPKVIITFGNQVSSIVLGKSIKVSEYRKRYESLKIGAKEFKVYPVYYPVGQGMRNIKKAKKDLARIIKNEKNN